MNYLLTICLSLFAFTLSAQQHAENRYVQGPEYKVIDRGDEVLILWEGEPAGPDQVKREDATTLFVYWPGGERIRLIVELTPLGGLKDVIDLKYRTERARLAAKNGTFDPAAPILVEFGNGLVFEYRDGEAMALIGDRTLPITGSDGRYRIETEAFEAGVAFGPEYGKHVYHYLTVK